MICRIQCGVEDPSPVIHQPAKGAPSPPLHRAAAVWVRARLPCIGWAARLQEDGQVRVRVHGLRAALSGAAGHRTQRVIHALLAIRLTGFRNVA
eukprot:CAMPEP_0206065610 /NCGR_PEP_ID=MMETSP1466-20131121/59317_1 /ASSEMBLY_ACC=CAM_ASM_001126 /TAXON_ID=44452 /ORGANISM="Pavlova gyrans, Strain CCMP608" /LENGTH=93 /DNA_ID=CAMNT_0053440985 /DNA_START=538 /DNA_END=819 /DNA_ORIENTATION=-